METLGPNICARALYVMLFNIPLKHSCRMLNLCSVYRKEYCEKIAFEYGRVPIGFSETAIAAASNWTGATDVCINCSYAKSFSAVSLYYINNNDCSARARTMGWRENVSARRENRRRFDAIAARSRNRPEIRENDITKIEFRHFRRWSKYLHDWKFRSR